MNSRLEERMTSLLIPNHDATLVRPSTSDKTFQLSDNQAVFHLQGMRSGILVWRIVKWWSFGPFGIGCACLNWLSWVLVNIFACLEDT